MSDSISSQNSGDLRSSENAEKMAVKELNAMASSIDIVIGALRLGEALVEIIGSFFCFVHIITMQAANCPPLAVLTLIFILFKLFILLLFFNFTLLKLN